MGGIVQQYAGDAGRLLVVPVTLTHHVRSLGLGFKLQGVELG